MSKIEVNEIDAQSGTTITVGSACKSVAVPGNVVKTNAVQASDAGNIISQSGTTITIGASGDTVTLGSGASQSGFGRTGTVDWDTTVKTSAFTAVNGDGFFTNTTSAAFTATLPASPSAGNIVAFADYAGTWSSNNLTLGRNGSNIEGEASDFVCNTSGSTITLVYIDATKGWVVVNSGNSNQVNDSKFVTATGGTETTCGNFKIHTFTGPGTFCVSCAGNTCGSNTVDYLVIAGGGGGGGGSGGAGGGAGGYRESSGAASGCYTRSPLGACVSALPVSVQGYPITVGGGGSGRGGPPSTEGCNGANSVFSTITSTGGGGGGAENPANANGLNGGSGGGGRGNSPNGSGGSGNTPPVSPPQGSNGGTGGGQYAGGGGGGATGTGGSTTNPAGAGGAGATSSINGTPTARAGGGGGGNQPPAGNGPGPGTAGGGDGGVFQTSFGSNATDNTGGGGGGGAFQPSCSPNMRSGNGGSGIVIIRYKFQ
jgi:hypothetical protein